MNVRPAIKTTVFCLRMDPRLKREAEQVAVHERRSLAGLIEVLLAERIEQQEQEARPCS